MADKKITQLSPHLTVTASDLLAVVDTAALETKKLAVGALRDFTNQGLISSSAQIATDISGAFTAVSSSISYDISNLQSISGSGFILASNDFEDLTLTRVDGTTEQLDMTPRRVRETIINGDSVTIQKGTPLYVSGSQANQSLVYVADAANPARMPATYVANTTLDPGQSGEGLLVGFITGVDTSAFNKGDNVWVAPGGGYTNQRPTGSNIQVQKLGNVIDVDPEHGSGVILGAGRANDVPNIQEGYFWVGNSNDVATPIATASFVSAIEFNQLADVSNYTASLIPNGYLPVWDSGSQQWTPGRPDFEQGKTRLFVAAARSNTSTFFFNSQTRTSDTSASPVSDSAFMLVSSDLDTITVHLRSSTSVDVTIDIYLNENGTAFSSATSIVTPVTTSLVANTISTTTFSGLTINQFDSIHIKVTPSGGGDFYGIVEIV